MYLHRRHFLAGAGGSLLTLPQLSTAAEEEHEAILRQLIVHWNSGDIRLEPHGMRTAASLYATFAEGIEVAQRIEPAPPIVTASMTAEWLLEKGAHISYADLSKALYTQREGQDGAEVSRQFAAMLFRLSLEHGRSRGKRNAVCAADQQYYSSLETLQGEYNFLAAVDTALGFLGCGFCIPLAAAYALASGYIDLLKAHLRTQCYGG